MHLGALLEGQDDAYALRACKSCPEADHIDTFALGMAEADSESFEDLSRIDPPLSTSRLQAMPTSVNSGHEQRTVTKTFSNWSEDDLHKGCG